MGILERMRSGSDSTFMQVVFAMIIVAFVGVYAQSSGDRSDVVATVNSVKIMDTELSRAYRVAASRAEQDAQRTLSDEEQKQLQEQVRQELIERQVLLQEAARLGIDVSYAEVARQLRELPFLRDEAGNFDKDEYTRFLKRQRYTKSDFETKLHDDLVQDKLRQLVFTGASLSEPAMRERYVQEETRVDLKIVRIRPSVFEDDVAITDEERTAWLAENAALVEETYEQDKARLYDHPEQVRVRMIRLAQSGSVGLTDLVARLSTLRTELVAGGDMEAAARRWSEDPSAAAGGDLGLRPVGQLTEEEAKALEEIEIGGITRPVTTDRDVRLLKLEERVPAKVDTLEDVRSSIADRLIRAERIPVLAARYAEEQVLQKWKETGAVPQDVLDQQGLTARDTGPIPTMAGGNPFAPPQRLLDAARTAAVGTVIDEVFEEGGTYTVAQLTDRVEPDMSKLEGEDVAATRERMLLSERDAFYQAWVDDLKSHAKIR